MTSNDLRYRKRTSFRNLYREEEKKEEKEERRDGGRKKGRRRRKEEETEKTVEVEEVETETG